MRIYTRARRIMRRHALLAAPRRIRAAYHVSAAALGLARRPERRRARRGEPSRGSSARLRGLREESLIYRQTFIGQNIQAQLRGLREESQAPRPGEMLGAHDGDADAAS